jgi:hypothetical protein
MPGFLVATWLQNVCGKSNQLAKILSGGRETRSKFRALKLPLRGQFWTPYVTRGLVASHESQASIRGHAKADEMVILKRFKMRSPSVSRPI